jgi:hypothetical protein
MATNGDIAASEQYTTASVGDTPAETASATGSSNHDLPKDEVGWYFVEQYYTTLSKNPEKLHVRTHVSSLRVYQTSS